jgi:hypothetical protein
MDDLYLEGITSYYFYPLDGVTDCYVDHVQRSVLQTRLKDLASRETRRGKARSLTKITRSAAFIFLGINPFFLCLLSSQPDLKPIMEKEIPKVVQAMRQTTSRKVLYKLLTRVKVCFARV